MDRGRSADDDDDCLVEALTVSARARLLVGDVAAARRLFAEILALAGDSATVDVQALQGLGITAVRKAPTTTAGATTPGRWS